VTQGVGPDPSTTKKKKKVTGGGADGNGGQRRQKHVQSRVQRKEESINITWESRVGCSLMPGLLRS
jgi:hypothetical protein